MESNENYNLLKITDKNISELESGNSIRCIIDNQESYDKTINSIKKYPLEIQIMHNGENKTIRHNGKEFYFLDNNKLKVIKIFLIRNTGGRRTRRRKRSRRRRRHRRSTSSFKVY